MLMSEVYSLFFLAFLVGMGFLSNFFLRRMNTLPLLIAQEERYPESFIAERAYHNLKVLNDFGPKVVGSEANEIKAAGYILRYAEELKANATNPDDVIIDHHVVSGYNFGMAMYENLQNIVVRLQGETDHVLMMNCHYDSVPGSPGASDDIVMCCVMLEIFRVLSQSPSKHKHSLVLLINGSEEQNLQASHGFITQNQWREHVRAYINLESTGSGGREILFRTGPKHDWLVQMYRKSAPRPFGHAISEELFETGVIPSATDFEIFRDYGKVPGLDFAYVEAGWRYHTRYDSIDYITTESVQYTGNNILPLTRNILNSDELVDPPEGTYAVFFEYLGLFMISYTASTGAIINFIVSILAVVIPFILQTKFKMENIGFVFFETLMSFVTIVVSTIASGVVCWGMAQIMNALDNTMSWYNTIFLSIGIYGSLALLIQIGIYHLMEILTSCCLKTKKYREASKRHRVKIHLNGVNLFWAVIAITLTAMGFRFGYLMMTLLLVSLCTYLLTFVICKGLSKTSSQSWVFVHIAGHTVVYLYFTYVMIQLWDLFTPIAGKVFYANPDVTIALILVLWMVTCMSYFVPLTRLVKHRAVIYSCLGTLFVVCTILSFTPVGFPYSDNKDEPRLQRFRCIHLKRTIYDPSGSVKFTSNTSMLYGWDRNSLRTLRNTFGAKELFHLQNDELCDQQYMCGFPHYAISDRTVTVASHNAAPNIAPTKFTLTNANVSGSSINIDFTLELRTLTHMSITLGDGLSYVDSNIPVINRTSNGKIHLMAQYTFGMQDHTPRRVKLQLEGTPETNQILATIAIKTIDSTFDQGKQEEGFKKIMQTFPDYTFSYVQQADSSIYEISAF